MTDRYDRGMQALRDAPVPDQWDDITARAAARGLVVPLDGPTGGPRWPRSPGWRLAAAVAASVAVLVGAVALLSRRDSNDAYTDDTTTTTTATTTDPDSTTTTTTTPDTAETPTAGAGTGTVPRPLPEELGNQPASACTPLPLTSTSPPDGLSATMEEPPASNPQVPPGLDLMGVFPGDTTQRRVFVASWWPDVGVETGTLVDGPFAGTQTWIAPYDDGWLAQVTVPLDPAEPVLCPVLLIGTGLDEADFRQFVAGLTLEG